MLRKTRIFCFTIAIFFLISCFTAVSCYASTENVTPEAQGGSGNIANDSADAGQSAEESDTIQDQETDSDGNEKDSPDEAQSTDDTSIDIEDNSSQADETIDQSNQDETNQDETTTDETNIDQTTGDETTDNDTTQDQATVDDSDKDASQSDPSGNNSDKTASNSNKNTNNSNKTEPKPKPANTESLWYISKIPMKKEHQKVLWDYCNSRKIDYVDMLALIYTESNFNEKANGKYKGYFQFSKGTCARMAKSLKTPNTPLDGKININWGTALYSSILKDKRVKNLTGKKRRDVALSIFQRGTEGYDRYGISTSYLKTYYKKWNIIRSYLKKS